MRGGIFFVSFVIVTIVAIVNHLFLELTSK
jgi:hypothetical protein